MAVSRKTNRQPQKASAEQQEEHSLGFWLRHAHRAFVRALGQELALHGILPAQWTVLRALWRRDGITQVELAEQIGVEKASLTGVLAGLDTAGLVRRDRDPQDGRKLTVRLTPAGGRLERKLLACGETVNRRATRDVSASQAADVVRLLQRLSANLDA